MPASDMQFYLTNAKVAQLVEHDLAKVGVASSNLVFRSKAFFIEGFYFYKVLHLLRWWNW